MGWEGVDGILLSEERDTSNCFVNVVTKIVTNMRTNIVLNIATNMGTNIVLNVATNMVGDRGSTVAKVLCYKSEGRWSDPRWFQWIIH